MNEILLIKNVASLCVSNNDAACTDFCHNAIGPFPFKITIMDASCQIAFRHRPRPYIYIYIY